MKINKLLIALLAVAFLLPAGHAESCGFRYTPFSRAQSLYSQKKYVEAGNEYLRLIDQDYKPHLRLRVLYNSARSFKMAGAFHRADQLFQRVILEAPRGNWLQRSALKELAKLSLKMLNYKQAVELNRLMVSWYPKSVDARNARLFLAQKGHKRPRR